MKYVLILLLILPGVHFLNAQDVDSTMVFPVKSGNKWTLRSQSGPLPQAPLFDSIFVGSKLYFFGSFKSIVKNKNRYGVIEYRDKCDTLVPIEYNAVIELSSDCYLLRKDDLWKTFTIQRWDNRKGKMVWGYEEEGRLDSIYVENEVAYFWKNGKASIKRASAKTFNSNYSVIRIFDQSVFNPGYQHRLKQDNYRNVEYSPELIYLVSDGKRFGLLRGSKELVPCVAESIQPYNLLFCRFWNGSYWKYVRYKDGFTIDPGGGNVVFYGNDCWKIYSTDRKKGTLYFNGTPFPVKGFEDYFLVSENHVAVRREGRIGLLSKKGAVLIPPIYEQIDFLKDNLFRVLKDGKWYLANANGILLSKSGYDFIGRPGSWMAGTNKLEIHEKGKLGVLLTNGTVLLSPYYHSIQFLDDYVLAEKNNIVTILGKDGKKLAEKNYVGYNLHNSFLIMYLDKHQKDLFAISGKLNQFPFAQLADLGEVVKLYGGKELEVLVLNPQRTIVEERQVYGGVVSFDIAGFDGEDQYFSLPDVFNLSYLEEHQLSGYFGYRKTFDTTHIMKPDYLECFDYGVFNWEIGIRKYELKLIMTSDNLKLTSFFDFQIINPESAKLFDDLTAYTSFSDYKSSDNVKSSESILCYSAEKGNFWLHDPESNASEVRNVNYSGVNSVAYYSGGNYVYTNETDPFGVSNYERFMKMNNALNLAPASEGIAEILNPKGHKKLSGGSWFVTNASSYYTPNKLLQDKYYSELHYLEGDYVENPTFIARNNSGNWIWNYQKGDSLANTSYSDIKPFDDLMLVEANSKVGVCLKNREVLLEPVYDAVYFLSWDLLMVRKDHEYGVVDFNKNWIVPLNE